MIARTAPLLAAAVPALAAPAYAAAEGGLQIFPDARVFVLIVIFLLLVYPTHKILLEPLLRVLDERRERIEGARARAEGLSRQADEVLGRYEAAVREARDHAEGARRGALDGARRDQNRITSGARAEAERELAAAREVVARELEAARGQLRGEAGQLAREAASQVLGRGVS